MLRIFFMTRSPYRQSTPELECPRVAAKVLRAAMPVWLNAPKTGGIGQRRFRPASFVVLVETEPPGPAAYHTRKGEDSHGSQGRGVRQAVRGESGRCHRSSR